MSGITPQGLRETFDRLIELTPEAREEALQALSIDQPELAAQLRRLLPRDTSVDLAEDPIAERVLRSLDGQAPTPTQLGPYRLLRLLGSGGMGWVYLAERDADGVRQQVALKLVRGNGERAVDDLFQRERSVLASLQHPYIARFLDAGSVDGQRYLVMEYVEGRSLADWLSERQPTLSQRLELLIALAEAVDHAHAKLVVHRDLKPANLLVRADDRPVLLDFGIAKLLDADEAKQANVTRVYTPTYAAPEQIAGQAVTVATDVHALGLLLFELLCGEAARSQEQAAPRTKPSVVARASSLPWVQHDAAAINVELDRIVAMALREEPERRYRSAADLVLDLRRWQRGLPVQAMPDRVSYRARKWLRRHRIGAALTLAALMATVFFVLQLELARQRALDAEREAERKALTAEAVADLMTDLFEGASPNVAHNSELSARALLERGAERLQDHQSGDPDIDAKLRFTVGTLFLEIGDPAEAVRQFDAGLAIPAVPALRRAELLHERSRALDRQGHNAAAESSARAALALREANLPAQDPAIAHTLQTLAVPLQKQGQGEAAEVLFKRAETIFAAQTPPDLEGLASIRHNLAWIAQRRGDQASAKRLYEQAVEAKSTLYGRDDPRTLNSIVSLAQVQASLGDMKAAKVSLQQAVLSRRKVNGEQSLETSMAISELAAVERIRGELTAAETHFAEALSIIQKVAPGSVDEARTLNNFATIFESRGDLSAAADYYRQSAALRRAFFGPDDANTLRAEHNLCRVLIESDPSAAASCASDIYARRQNVLKASDPELDDTRVLMERLSQHPDRVWLSERFEYYRKLGPEHLLRCTPMAWLLASRTGADESDLVRLDQLAESLRLMHGDQSVGAALSELYRGELALRLAEPDLARVAFARAEGVLLPSLAKDAPARARLELLRSALAGSK